MKNFSTLWLLLLSSYLGFTQDYSSVKDNATLLGNTRNWCSAKGEYKTSEFTYDRPTSSCYDKPFTYGKWFKFLATSKNIEIKLKIGDGNGSMIFPYLSLWTDQLQEIKCIAYLDDTTNVSLNSADLDVGKWYYVQVNNHNLSKYVGSFTLCLNSELSYDFLNGAKHFTQTSNWCSEDKEFTTSGGSPDEKKPSCLSNGPNFNRWFSFDAKSESISIVVKTGGSMGTAQFPYITLWDEQLNELDCDKYTDSDPESHIEYKGLVIGNKYYFSVDHQFNDKYQGSFAICIDDGLKKENVVLKIADFDKTDLITITGRLLFDKPGKKPTSKIWLLDNKEIPVDSSTTDENGKFQFVNLPPDHNFLVLIENEDNDIKVEIFQTGYNGEIIKKMVKLDKRKYGFEDLPLQCNKIILIDCKSHFDLEIEQGKTGVIGKVVKRANPTDGSPNIEVKLYDSPENMVAKTVTDENGKFNFINLPPNSGYSIRLDANLDEVYAEMLMLNDHGNAIMSSNSKDVKEGGVFKFERLPYIEPEVIQLMDEQDVELPDFTMLETGKAIELNNIYFELGEATLLTVSFKELDRLSNYLQGKDVKIEVHGHTDNVGSADLNLKLSKERAKSVVDYLVTKGISSSRMTYIGYGQTKPIADNSTPEGRKKNRRVEFKVLK